MGTRDESGDASGDEAHGEVGGGEPVTPGGVSETLAPDLFHLRAPTASERAGSEPTPGPRRRPDDTGDTLSPIDTEGPERPDRVGPYRVLGELGRGGMGVVYRAEQENPRRLVAIKVIRSTVASDRARRRFAFEAEVLARLDHPGIARILEARHEGHRSWFAMEYVQGQPIHHYVEDHHLDLRERLELIAKLCDAVHHAHLHGVVHRDLKPANVLVTEDGQPHVLDFGIARATDPALAAGTHETRVGELVGTPLYMSPEQASLSTTDLDGRSDVYTLRVIAYELIGGRPPNDLSGKTIAEMLQTVREVDAPRLGRIDHTFSGDVETIVAKALEKAPARRYQSAAALAEDIRRYLADEPINARPATAAYQLSKFARRNPALAVSIHGLVAALFVGVTASTALGVKALRERNAAVAARRAVEQRNAQLTLLQARAVMTSDPTLSVAWLEGLSGVTDPSAVLATGWEARRRGVATDVLTGDDNEVRSVTWAPDGRHVATGAYDATVRIWDLATHRVQVLPGRNGDVQRVAYSPAGVLLAAAEDGTITLDDHGRITESKAGDGEVSTIAWSPDGATFVTGGRDHAVRLWHADGTLDRLLVREGGPVAAVAFSPDGTRVAAASEDGAADVVTLPTGKIVRLLGHEAALHSLAWSPDGTEVATSSNDHTVRVGDAATGAVQAVLPHGHEARDMAFTPDGATLVTSGRDGRLGIWDLRTGTVRWIAAHTGPLRSLVLTEDGHHVVTGGDDGDAALWDIQTGVGWRLRGHRARIRQVAMHGTWLATASSDGTARIWDLDPSHRGAWVGHTAAVTDLAVTPGHVISASEDGTARAWDVRTGRSVVLRAHRDQVEQAVALPDGRAITGGRDATVRLWDPSTGAVTTWAAPDRVDELAVSPDGQCLVVGSKARDVRLIHVPDGTFVDEQGHTDKLLAVAFAAESTHFATGSADQTARVWRVGSQIAERVETFDDEVTSVTFGPGGQVAAGAGDGEVRVWSGDGAAKRLPPHEGAITGLAFLPDGRLASIGLDRIVRVYDPKDGTFVDWTGHTDTPTDLVVTPDGAHVVTCGRDGTVRVWEVATGKAMTWWGAQSPLRRVVLLDDGATLAAAGDDGWVRTWPLTPDTDPDHVRTWLDALTDARLDADDALAASWKEEPAPPAP